MAPRPSGIGTGIIIWLSAFFNSYIIPSTVTTRYSATSCVPSIRTNTPIAVFSCSIILDLFAMLLGFYGLDFTDTCATRQSLHSDSVVILFIRHQLSPINGVRHRMFSYPLFKPLLRHVVIRRLLIRVL